MASSAVSIIALVFANLIPVVCVFVLDWDVSMIVLLYWTENVVIGVYNVLRIAVAKVEHPIEHLGKLFLVPFFCVHFGGFCAVHGMFLVFMFKIGGAEAGGAVMGDPPAALGPLVFLYLLAGVFRHLWNNVPGGLAWPFTALMASHGISFVHNYLLRGEFKTASSKELMGRPYVRIVVLHVVIIAGAAAVMALGSPMPLLFLLIAVKIALDIVLHIKSHAKKKEGSGGQESA